MDVHKLFVRRGVFMLTFKLRLQCSDSQNNLHIKRHELLFFNCDIYFAFPLLSKVY